MNSASEGIVDFFLDLFMMLGLHRIIDGKGESKPTSSSNNADDDSKSGKNKLPAWMTKADETIFGDLLRKLSALFGEEVFDDSIKWYAWLKKIHKVRKAVLLRHLVYKMETDQEQIEFLSMFILIIQTRQESDYQKAVDMLDFINADSSEDILDKAGEWFKGPGAIYFTKAYYLNKLERVAGKVLDIDAMKRRCERINTVLLPRAKTQLQGELTDIGSNFLLGTKRKTPRKKGGISWRQLL